MTNSNAAGDEFRIAYLRPSQILKRLADVSVVYIPLAMLEWHGPHLPYGTDPLSAERIADDACRLTGGLVWPTVYFGTERERSPKELESLGFSKDQYVVGMDFPANSLPSAYCSEEIFGIIVREALREVASLKAKLAVIVNGHGGANHVAVLHRLTTEFNHTTALHVLMPAWRPPAKPRPGGGHADWIETSMMMSICPQSVDLSELPDRSRRLRFVDFGIVSGGGFSGKGPADKTVEDSNDPRLNSTAEMGRQELKDEADWLAKQVQEQLNRL